MLKDFTRQKAHQTFDHLQEQLDKLIGEHAEIDIEADQLIIQISPTKQFLLNFHGVTQQVWLSSPLTGAHHFDLENGKWICSRTQRTLNNILCEDLQTLFARSFNLLEIQP